jgi:Tol biopolymer transport system component
VRILVVASLAAALAVVPLDAVGTRDAFPGRDGLVVFASDRTSPSASEIYAARVGGGAPRNLTRSEGWEARPLPSPDGRWIAFEAPVTANALRSIFLMDADGSGRRLLVEGEHASWAPDSRSLAFHDHRSRIAVVDVETCTVRTLAEGALPAWSPDGRLIAFLRGPRLAVVAADGGDVREVAPGMVVSGVAAFSPVWSPDSARLVFAGGRADDNGFARSSQIQLVRVADGAVTSLTSGGRAKSSPHWSPDGRTIVYSENARSEPKNELVVVGADGGGRRLLTRGRRFTYDLNPAWSPDGAWVAFTRGRADTVPTDVMVVRRDGSGLRRLTQPRSGLAAYDSPAWSRDGRAVIYARGSSDRDHDLFTVGPGGGEVRRLTDNVVRDSYPSWSPDGSLIAFVRTLASGPLRRVRYNEELFVMRADGTGQRRLTHFRFEDLMPSWSPDGSRIVFARRVPQSLTALYTIRPDGTGLRRVARAPAGFHSDPAWSPDGRRIAFTAGNGLEFGGELYVMDADGSHVRRRARIAEVVWSPQWSPDGRRLAVNGLNSCGRGCELNGVYVLRSDGRNVLKVAEGSRGLAWSPDGSELVLALDSIVTLDLRSGETREIVHGDPTSIHELPDWQPRCTRSGTSGRDRLAGGSGAELLCGLGGDDRIRGGRGRDRLFGGDGDDRIVSRDGAFDVVGCGPGRDTVLADRRDLVGEDCERLTRLGAPAR